MHTQPPKVLLVYLRFYQDATCLNSPLQIISCSPTVAQKLILTLSTSGYNYLFRVSYHHCLEHFHKKQQDLSSRPKRAMNNHLPFRFLQHPLAIPSWDILGENITPCSKWKIEQTDQQESVGQKQKKAEKSSFQRSGFIIQQADGGTRVPPLSPWRTFSFHVRWNSLEGPEPEFQL